MKLFSLGNLAAVANLGFGFGNTFTSTNAFWSTFGAIALVTGGVLIGISIMERFTRQA